MRVARAARVPGDVRPRFGQDPHLVPAVDLRAADPPVAWRRLSLARRWARRRRGPSHSIRACTGDGRVPGARGVAGVITPGMRPWSDGPGVGRRHQRSTDDLAGQLPDPQRHEVVHRDARPWAGPGRELSLSDPIGKYVPGIPNGDRITLAELAGMRSGVKNYTSVPGLREGLRRRPRPPMDKRGARGPGDPRVTDVRAGRRSTTTATRTPCSWGWSPSA